ncbi:hypothetical protein SOCE26_014570 [Sorangium cellulosum]|uniref:Cyclic nucleotide-binding domain-containing protein n=1 Tax=Sorangium cellulosum TaxID=56 RepID=A0A2L0EL83_SORCE|nr:tetratricopeptide repeat protein [Sorangium cellulosum]AUX40061.1 hypothetical protein SOCE26_014570 [Sorangium cellulosum]
MTVKDLVRRARKARDSGKWNEAYDAYKAALDAADPVPSTSQERAELTGELGLCELALRKYRDAAEHLTWSLEQGCALTDEARLRFEMGQAKAAFYVIRLLLSVDPPDAEVFIDGKSIGPIARTYKLFLEPGQHMVRTRAPGREDALQMVRAEASAEIDLSMQLTRAAPRSAKDKGPAAPEPASASPAARPQAPSPWASWPGTLRIGGIAVTTATAAAGAVFLLRAHVVHGNLREADVVRRQQGWTSHTCREATAPAACAGIHDQVNQRDLFATLGKVSLATSAVFGVATAASFFTEVAVFGSAPRATSVRIVPVTTSERAGVLLEGAW